VVPQSLLRRHARGEELGRAAEAAADAEQLVVEHPLPERGHRLCLCHGDLLSAGVPKPGDPDRRRTLVYGLKYASRGCKGLNMALLSHFPHSAW
jgi:hypothetical protein